MKKSPVAERQFKKQRKQPKLSCQIEMEADRISNLPGNIVDEILSHLTLRDAVRTSILSRNWRYNWKNLTTLVFDDPSLLEDQVLKNIVDHVLVLHNGLIHKFKLSDRQVDEDEVSHSDVDRWILFLSQRPIKEFTLDMFYCSDGYKLPSYFYLWDKLSHLDLNYCMLKPPSAFNGFKMLTSLALHYIVIDQDDFENLIYSCPLLERLTLVREEDEGFVHLKIHAPKLTFLDVAGEWEDFNFENTFHLSNVSTNLWNHFFNDHEATLGHTSKLIKFFASLPSIRRLEGKFRFLKILAGNMVPRRLPTPCIELNYLSLGINFNNNEECQAALCILRSSPNLLKLKLSAQYFKQLAPRAVTENLMEEDYQNCFLNRLRFVKIVGIHVVPRELNFINFLLANSPILERMTVKGYSTKSGWELVKELLRFKRASAHAEIILDPARF